MMVIPRAEQLIIIQRVHAKWAETYDDRDDYEANAVHYQMVEEAMAETEEKYKARPTAS